MSQKPSIPKGTRDFLPQIMIRREHIFATIRQVFKKYGYAPIETPSMENLSVLTGKYGDEGDRLIFKILNNGDFLKGVEHLDDAQKLGYEICDRALRYDLTVPFARFVVMNQNELTFPFKRYQIQPVWRADRPQKGRYREFYQCDADVVGSDSLLFEAEFVAIFDEVLSALRLPGFSILLNNRKILSGYAEVAGQSERFGDICVAIDKLDKKPAAEVQAEMLSRGIPQDAIDTLFNIITFEGDNRAKLAFLEEALASSEQGRQGVAEMKEVLDTLEFFPSYNGTVKFDLQLARGLDYYTGTIFEVKAHEVSIGSICGGGRYADLTGVFGMPGLSGVGISFGADRIYDVMNELNLFQDDRPTSTKVLLINFGGEGYKSSLKLLSKLRQAGIPTELYPEEAKLKKQFSYADKLAIPFTVMIGEEEVKNGLYQLKNMFSGEQISISESDLIESLT
ncbi:MAG: histidine--tRNA ligase [Bacteroidia bacterium]|nr:histidine--tRNA ligase [Bacteroidia bacterium]